MKPVWLIAAICALALVGCGSDSSAPAGEAKKEEAPKTEAPKEEAPKAEAPAAEAAKNPFVVVAVTDEKDGKASKETLSKDAEKL